MTGPGVYCHWRDRDPTPIRLANAGENIWEEREYRVSSGPVQPIRRRRTDAVVSKRDDAAAEELASQTLEPTPKTLELDSTLSTSPGESLEGVVAESPHRWAYPLISNLLADYGGVSQDSEADDDWLKQVESQ